MAAKKVDTSINFVVDGKLRSSIEHNLNRINKLFGVKAILEDAEAGKPQWISIDGSSKASNKAKEYILALVSPEVTIPMNSVWGHPLFTEKKRSSIENETCAVLTQCENDGVMLSGTQMSVMTAMSLIDGMFSRRVSDSYDRPSQHEEMIVDEDDAVNSDCFLKQADEPVEPKSALVKSKGKTGQKKKPKLPAASTSQRTLRSKTKADEIEDVSKESSHSLEQKAYLSYTASALNHYDEDIEVALAMFNMDDIIKPAEFTHKVAEIARKRQHLQEKEDALVKPQSDTNKKDTVSKAIEHKDKQGASSQMDLDASVICIDFSDNDEEETVVMRPYGDMNAAGKRVGATHLDYSAIVLSSDDEDGETTTAPTKAQQDHTTVKPRAHPSTTATIPSSNQYQPLNRLPDYISLVPTYKATTSLPKKVPNTNIVTQSTPSIQTHPRADIQPAIVQPTHPKPQEASQSLPSSALTAININYQDRTLVNPEIVQPSAVKGPVLTVIGDEGQAPGPSQDEMRQAYIDELMKADRRPKEKKCGPRYIVIDGSNVAMSHGDNGRWFSVSGIEICIKYFLKRGHTKITAFVPEWRRYSDRQVSSDGRKLLERLNKAGFVKFTPARRVGNQVIATYDDRYILNLAVEEEGVVVSNDLFRDLQPERQSYREVATHCLLQYTFVQDHFMPADQPMGRNGPPLDMFLQYGTHNNFRCKGQSFLPFTTYM